MQLTRYAVGRGGEIRIGVIVDDIVHDVTGRFPTIAAVVAAHPDGWTPSVVDRHEAQTLHRRDVTLLPPIDRSSTLYLVGANYRQHAEEAGLAVPKTPVFFTKPPTALVGQAQPIVLPPVSCLHHGGGNELWIGTENNGLYTYNLFSNNVAHYDLPPIQYIFEDRFHLIWVLTSNGYFSFNYFRRFHFL